MERKQGEIRRLQKLCEKTAIAYEQMHEKYLEQLHLRYAAESALEEEKGKNQKLRAQLNRDYENSSIPSSKSLRPKKVANSREKTGRKPGAQPGHKGHCRKKQEPTVPTVFLPPPEAVLEDPDFKKTAKTGERVHAAFPDGVINDVNYDGSIRAFLFLLNNDCCASIDKSRKFLSDLTGGKLNISKGMISRLSRESALKTEPERRAAYADMLFSPVMHTDCTNARENGKGCYVYVCATPDGKALYFARAKKGHEGVKGTVAEDYQGIFVHDHDITFYSYGRSIRNVLPMYYGISKTVWIMNRVVHGIKKCMV